MHRRLDGPQGRSGQAENLVPTGIRSRTVQPVAQSLYRLSYRAHIYTHTLEGNGTLVPSNRAVAELRLRPLGLWNLVYTTETVSFNSLIDRCQISLEITTAPTQSKG